MPPEQHEIAAQPSNSSSRRPNMAGTSNFDDEMPCAMLASAIPEPTTAPVPSPLRACVGQARPGSVRPSWRPRPPRRQNSPAARRSGPWPHRRSLFRPGDRHECQRAQRNCRFERPGIRQPLVRPRHDPNDGERGVVHRDRAPDGRRGSIEQLGPQGLGDHDDRGDGALVLVDDQPSAQRPDPDGREEVHGHRVDAHETAHAAGGDGDVASSAEGGEIREPQDSAAGPGTRCTRRRRSARPVPVCRTSTSCSGCDTGRLEEQRVEEAEDRRVRADPDGEREDGHGGEPGRPAEVPPRVAQVLAERVEPLESHASRLSSSARTGFPKRRRAAAAASTAVAPPSRRAAARRSRCRRISS